MKVLNLYAGIGGNRKHWENCQVTAVESDTKIAEIYQDLFPNDEIIVGDAHEYLLHHANEYDFIWSSPPCQSHSRMIRSGRNRKPRYPDFTIYEEIVFLEYNYDGLYVVENVVPYYEPLVKPSVKMGRHLFWSNFNWEPMEPPKFSGFISKQNLENKKQLMEWLGLYYEKNVYYNGNHCPTQVLRNCVHPKVGQHIFKSMPKAK